MKTIAICIALAATMVSNSYADVHSTYADAYAAAEKDGKPLVVLVTAPAWCPPCRLLDKTVKPMLKDGSFDSVHFFVLDYDTDRELANRLDPKKRVPAFVRISKVPGASVTYLRGNQTKSQIIKFLGEKNGTNRQPSSFKLF